MLTHVVIFRTRNKEKAPMILEGLETLKQIEGVKFIHIGAPVPSERPVVDDFFDYAKAGEVCKRAERAERVERECKIQNSPSP